MGADGVGADGVGVGSRKRLREKISEHLLDTRNGLVVFSSFVVECVAST